MSSFTKHSLRIFGWRLFAIQLGVVLAATGIGYYFGSTERGYDTDRVTVESPLFSRNQQTILGAAQQIDQHAQSFEAQENSPRVDRVSTSPGFEDVMSRLTNGYFVSPTELPGAQEGVRHAVLQYVKSYRHKVDEEYDSLFGALGIDSAMADKLKSHLATIEHSRAEAENYLIGLDRTKEAYDSELKKILNSAQYEVYRQAELDRPATRELSAFKEYLTGANAEPLTASEEEVLLAALKASKQTPTLDDGPYGRGPRALAGKEKVLAALVEDFNVAQQEYQLLTSRLSENEAWGSLRGKTDTFYANRLSKIQQEIQFVSGPPPTPEQVFPPSDALSAPVGALNP